MPEFLQKIDAVSLNPLCNCMQTVFEDGPKRDRRLWIASSRRLLLRRYDDVILFAFAQQQVPAEKQVACRHRALEV